MSDMIAEEKEALDRIARTPDGMMLHRYLRRVLEHVADIVDDGTLRAQTGRRSLARDLMVLMAPGIEDVTSGRPAAAATAPILRSPAGRPAGRPGTRAEQRRAAWAVERTPPAGSGTEPA